MNLKKLIEQYNTKKSEMKAIANVCREENRSLTDEETTKFDALEKECDELSATIERIQKADAQEAKSFDIVTDAKPVERNEEETAKNEVHEFANYVRQMYNHDIVDANITRGDNGGIIPTTIANKIIDRVKEISPIFNDVTRYSVKGSLYIPYVGADDDNITAGYANEFTDLTATATKLSVVQLSNYLVGLQVNASKSLINNTDINLTNFIVEKMAKAVAAFFEKETLIGTDGKATGLSTLAAAQKVETATANKITFDDIIDLMAKVKSPYQNSAYFVMNGDTLTTLRKVKDGASRYVLNADVSAPFGFTLLGKTVYVSDNMPTAEGGNTAIFYGDYAEGLAANITEEFELQVLMEKYATQHAIGFVGWAEFDEKIQNEQALAALVVKQ